ncbi:ABC transporter substrate-binding protein [Actinomadura parmotrematis]|uniref:Sugar ABC transporter substrate-binding protein n=1 Tax=Actinomadura parmotrematis TaxID=2864039 RepID=A0ABS7G394_9ACTN|nr:sugar ABC transporter substrate-binding protein [Actinomadura parmotrematis]MBW8487184.1 sugar ABC transporter substrate-binding protein [Actinomadura parmotrematis]
MRLFRTTALAAATTLALSALAACGGDGGSGGGDAKTITYWASNQGADLSVDKKVLAPELAKFEQQTGIHVKYEVVPWSDLLKRILAAATSGQGPDVLNIGNTWSASLQATGALQEWDDASFAKIGGKDRFLASSLSATGAAGKTPAAVPLYSLAYALYYNKKRFADAGIDKPPATWSELVATGKKLTKDGKYGLAIEGANNSENAHHAFVFAKQHGGDFFDAAGKPTLDSQAAVEGVTQYVNLLAGDKIAAPGNAEYMQNESVRDLATGKAAMLLWQAAGTALKARGMKEDDYGVAPVPVQSGAPGQGAQVNSMVAGINIAMFKNTKNKDGAFQFVKFMTSDAEQKTLNTAYGSLPSVKAAQEDPAFNTPERSVLRKALAESAAPLPQVAAESQFEDLVGAAMKELFAQAAAGKPVTADDVRKRLQKAQQQMPK